MLNISLFNILKIVNFIDKHYFISYQEVNFKNSQLLNNKPKSDKVIRNFVSSNFLSYIHRKMGEYVKFGEDVVFRHVDSLDFLSGSVRCSDGGLGAFKVELSDQLSQNLVFKLYPFRSF
jgi:hypothetical protein